ncbi:MAG: hypothetical protein ACR2P7_04595 [bacterium]
MRQAEGLLAFDARENRAAYSHHPPAFKLPSMDDWIARIILILALRARCAREKTLRAFFSGAPAGMTASESLPQ